MLSLIVNNTNIKRLLWFSSKLDFFGLDNPIFYDNQK